MGSFLFWVIWPYFVSRHTRTAYLMFTGKTMPKENMVALRKDLSKITGAYR